MSANVFDEMTCPECGGHIGLGSDGNPGRKPCTCFTRKQEKARLQDEPDPIDMMPVSTGDPTDVGASRTDGKKLCRVCKKDLSGRSRLKDDKGYICKKCSDAEFLSEDQHDLDSIQCPECLRKLKAEAFLEYRGNLICKRCHSGHLDNDKLKVAKLGELKLHAKEEKKSVLILAIVGGVLALALLIKTAVIGW